MAEEMVLVLELVVLVLELDEGLEMAWGHHPPKPGTQ
jgi:hypothetical protein